MIKSIALRAFFALCILSISCSKDEDEAPDTTPPSVDFTIKGITQNNIELPIIGNTIEIEIDAQDAKGMSKVEAFLDDNKVGEDNAPPFKITIDLTTFAKKLSGKGTVISKTQTQYTLKVTATDLAGNVASVEQEIIVDNEMPTITGVSLETNTVIGGGENLVTFTAEDNKEIMSLEVKINDVVLETTALENNTYAINIDSFLIDDGASNLDITASDHAGNMAIYNSPFVVDNTGPEINLEGLSAASIVDETSLFTISGEDLYSNVASLRIFVNDELILSSDDASELSLDFNPDDYATGDATLKIDAIDALGNESTLERSFQIKRLLLKINVPSGFLDPTVSKFYVFASNNTGELLDIKPLEYNTSIIKLSTFEDVAPNTDYMLNFAYLYNGTLEKSIIKTIQNVKRSSMNEMALKVPERMNASVKNTYQATEMTPGISLVGEGTDYHSQYDYIHGNGYIIDDYNYDTQVASNEYYLYSRNSLNNNYEYQFFDKPLATDFYIDFNNFITEGVETRYLNSSSIQDPNKFSDLTLYGYRNAADLDNNIKHQIWALVVDNGMVINGAGYRYNFNTIFQDYSYMATLENYRIEAMGAPQEFYNAPNWSVDYTYSSTTKTFSLNKSGNTHNLGKIYMNLLDNNSLYTWIVLFDSQSTNEVVLPRLPQELQSWNINNYYVNGNLNVEQIEVKKYDGLDTYDNFLQTVIKNSEYEQLKVSDRIESVFKTNVGAYISRPDFSFSPN